MGQHTATVEWRRAGATFTDNRYSRAHRWSFDGGATVPASASPSNVPLPLSDPAAVDPEEAFVAALSSCHMLWFLSLAAKRGFVVESYRDAAVGELARNDVGKRCISVVMLSPDVVFGGERRPSREEVEALHHEAHEECYLANSVRSDVRVSPVWNGTEREG